MLHLPGSLFFLDVLAVCGARVDTRSLFRVWQTRPSDVEGCINMHNPHPLAPRMALGHVSIPVLCLIDALVAQGYRGEKCLTTHTATSPKEFDSRHVLTKRCYLQCILALPELLRAGVDSFQSGQQCLLLASASNQTVASSRSCSQGVQEVGTCSCG